MSKEKNTPDLPLGLYWKDKRTTVDRTVLPFQKLEVIETINESRATREAEKGYMFRKNPEDVDTTWRNKLIWGDNKYAMAALLEKYVGQIDLIYIDPPFATGSNFETTVNIGEDELEHTKESSAIEEIAYRDTWGNGLDSFLQMMYDRLIVMRDLLSEKGSIYVHVDYRVHAYLKILMDEIFGVNMFRNEIIWFYRRWSAASSTFQKMHDDILWYSKTDKFKLNQIHVEPTEGQKVKHEKGWDRNSVYIEGRRQPQLIVYNKQKVDKAIKSGQIDESEYARTVYVDISKTIAPDVWEINFINSQAKERLGYPTQKPEALLERVIKASSNEGDLIADFFCGSGTTGSVAEKLGRRWVMADLGRFSVHTARKRLLEIEGCKPFEILNIGKYERQYWQSNIFNKKSKEQTLAEYISFILQLYKANPIPGSQYVHGEKNKELVHVGSVEAPVTLEDIQKAIEETLRMKQKNLTILGWEWEMGLHNVVEQEAKKAGVKLTLLNIPREVMDKRATDAGEIAFYELAYLETEIKNYKSGEIAIVLKDFVIPNLDLIPKEVRSKIKKWSDYIDYWSVDWNYQGDTFHNMWQTYRTKQDRTLLLKSDPYEYAKKGKYQIMIKVIDIFGNDTTHLMNYKVG